MNDATLFGLALVSFDLSKAFDSIDCSLTIHKMREIGFPSGFLCWLRNYFHNRIGRIKNHGKFSKEFILSRGVPQGSVLGPTVFCAHINDIKSSLSNVTTVKHADDINLIIRLSCHIIEVDSSHPLFFCILKSAQMC